jgi:hypothetical protein
MKKELELAIKILENSRQYDLKQIDYIIDGNTLKVFSKDYSAFHATSLIGTLSSISNLHSYLDYDQNFQKTLLVLFS